MLRHPLARAGLAAALAASMLITSALTATAAGPDGAYARFNLGGGAGGLVVLSYTGATTVNAGVVGLLASQEYFLRGSSKGCGTQPAPGNRVFKVRGTTNAHGGLWLRRSPSIAATVHSLWLGPTDGSNPAVCAAALNFENIKVTYGFRDAALSLWDKEHVLSLLERRPNSTARLSLVIDLGAGDDTFNVIGSKRSCERPASGPSNVFKIKLEDILIPSYSVHEIHMNQGNFNGLRSVRVHNLTTDQRSCAPLSIIAILIG